MLRIPVPCTGATGAAWAAVPVRGTAVAVGVAARGGAVETAGCAGGCAMVTGGTAGTAGSAVVPAGGGRAVVTAGAGRIRPGSGVCQSGTHTERGCAKRTGDG
jgi:hypothetical protein